MFGLWGCLLTVGVAVVWPWVMLESLFSLEKTMRIAFVVVSLRLLL